MKCEEIKCVKKANLSHYTKTDEQKHQVLYTHTKPMKNDTYKGIKHTLAHTFKV